MRRAAGGGCVGLLCLLAVLVLSFSSLPSPISSLTVHLVPHTHDDVGWLKTVDQYFIGSNISLQEASVHDLITATMAALKRVPERRFVYVEQAFFQRWWRQQNDDMQALVRSFVTNGQLEFINGGWCMHDEATTHYVDMVDQTTLGHQYILKEFGAAANPTIGWQVDPFGHSSTQAALLSGEVGFDALFFGRIDYQDHDWRVAKKEMQFQWAPSPSLGMDGSVWTEVALDGNYNPPGTFCWDRLCGNEGYNEQIQDRDDLEDKNVDRRVADFIRAAYDIAATRKGDIDTMHMQWNMGSDFNYNSAEHYFINMDKIIAAVNRNGTIKAQYSTPSQYYKAKMAEGIDWSVKTDDFFPYAGGPHNQWTGYFTSRPGVKGYVRSSSILLQAARQLEVFTGGDGTGTEPAWEAVGVAQHHDAVSGTERQHVAYDYTQRIARGNALVYATLDSALSTLSANGGAVIPFRSCPLLNVSQCSVTRAANDSFAVIVYNPDATSRSESGLPQRFFSLPLFSTSDVTVTDSAGNEIYSEPVPVPVTSATTADSASMAVSFYAPVPGLGFDTFFVYPNTDADSGKRRHRARPVWEEVKSGSAPVTIANSLYRLTFDSSTGLVTTVAAHGVSQPFSQSFGYYQSSEGDNGQSNSYTFQVKNATGFNPATTTAPQLKVYRAATVQMLQQTWGDWLSQTWRLYSDGLESGAVHVEWTVGPIPFEDGIPREVVTRYVTSIASAGEYWTDSNGREFQRRVRDQRPSFNYTVVDPISGNYYPVTTAAGLNSSSSAFFVLVDRAEGAASLQDGSLEVMLHRRILCPCGFDENLNETDAAVYDVRRGELTQRLGEGLIVTGHHRLLFGSPDFARAGARIGSTALYKPFHPVFAASSPSVSASQWAAQQRRASVTFLKTPLPENVDLMTLQVLLDGSVLLRLSHQFAAGETELGQPATVDLSTLFVQPVVAIKQVTLTANADYSSVKQRRASLRAGMRLSEDERQRLDAMHAGLQGTTVTIHPMQILSFVLSF